MLLSERHAERAISEGIERGTCRLAGGDGRKDRVGGDLSARWRIASGSRTCSPNVMLRKATAIG